MKQEMKLTEERTEYLKKLMAVYEKDALELHNELEYEDEVYDELDLYALHEGIPSEMFKLSLIFREYTNKHPGKSEETFIEYERLYRLMSMIHRNKERIRERHEHLRGLIDDLEIMY